MGKSITVHVSVWKPFDLSQPCPQCGFESMHAFFYMVNQTPNCRVFCGRPVCRESGA